MTDAGPTEFEPLRPSGSSVRSSVARIGVATAISAICGYTVLYLAARELGPALFSVFGVFWGAFGLVTGAANGLLQETTREVRLSLAQRERSPLATTLPIRIAVAFAIASAVGIVGTAPLWASHVFTEFRWLSVALLAGGLAGFCMHATTLGALAGSNRWTQYGVLMVTDAGIRLVVAVVTFAATIGLVGYLWATVAGSMSWLLLTVVSKPTREALTVPALVDTMEFLRGARHSIAAAAASAVLVMGFPVLLQSTTGDLGTTGGVVILAVTLTRAPLLVPLTALQGNLIAHFVDERDRRLSALITPAAIITGVGAVGVALATTVGPWLLRTVFDPAYQAGGPLLGWLTAGAVMIALLTLTGAATVAHARHRAYSAGWVGATVVSALLLLLPLDLEVRTVIALIGGPVVGIVVHVAALAFWRDPETTEDIID
ncbi:lipopolysaccharide biosynthesis protein [Mycobacteriaceae bacterium NPDC060252]